MEGLKYFIVFVFAAIATAEVVNFVECPDSVKKCKTNEVRILPCLDKTDNGVCIIKRGHSAQIQFDFTPDFDSTTLEGRVFWAKEIDLPLIGMESDGCKFTNCPVNKGQTHAYNFTLPISRKFPAGSYDIKWRLSGAQAEEQECCFITYIKLIK